MMTRSTGHRSCIALLALIWGFGATVQAQTVGNESSSSSTAIDALTGKNKSMSYEQALAAVEQAAQSGDVVAKRTRVLIWLMDLPHENHRRSFTNAFVLLQETPELDRKAVLGKLPDTSSEELQTLADIDGFSLEKGTNPLTDQESCRLTSVATDGLRFGFDALGPYIESEFPIALSDFESMGLRIDKHQYHPGRKPDTVVAYEKQLNAAKTLYVNGAVSLEEAQKLRPPEPVVKKLSLEDGSMRAQQSLLRELAVGREVVLRIVDRDGKERVSRFPLGEQKIGEKVITLADFPAYAYARCMLR